MQVEELKSFLDEKVNTLEGEVGIYIKFLDSENEYAHNAVQQFNAASTIKSLIAAYFFEQVSQNLDFDITTKVTIKSENMVKGSGIVHLLSADASYTYLDLVKLMVILSDNAAANEIIDFLGWQNINSFIARIGLTDTQFRHKMMIEAGRGPNLTTPYDMGLFFEMLYKKEFVKSQQQLEILDEVKLRDRIPELLPNSIKVSHKPGSLPDAVHDVGLVYAKEAFVFSFFSTGQHNKVFTKNILSQCVLACFNFAQSS